MEDNRPALVDFACPGCGGAPERQVVGHDQITCSTCGTSRPYTRRGLVVVTGCPGTGKSTVGRHLVTTLPSEMVVLDSDLTARAEHDSSGDAWMGFIDTWLRTAVGLAQGGRTLVLVGYSMPEDWERQRLRHFLGTVRSIALVCSDDELDTRLRRRSGMDEDERASLLRLNNAFRSRTDITIVDTTVKSPRVVADKIASLLATEHAASSADDEHARVASAQRGQDAFDELVASVRAEPDLVGLALAGSRGKGAETIGSDYDVYVFVRSGGDVSGWQRRLAPKPGDRIDLAVIAIDELDRSPSWSQYGLAHVAPVVDKLDGGVRAAIDAFATPPPSDHLAGTLDACINAIYRACKSKRRGLELETRLDAADAVSFFLTFAFAHAGRLRPYNTYLGWELAHHPVQALPWEAEATVSLFREVLDGSPSALVTLFLGAEDLARRSGLGHVVDAWDEGSLRLMQEEP